MNSKINLICILLFFFLADLVNAQTFSRAPAAIASFPDGSFENGPKTWSFRQNSTELGIFEISDYKPHSGQKCAKLTIKNISPEIWHVQLVQRRFRIEKNVIYKFSYWARGENGAGVLEVAFVKGSPPWSFYGAKKESLTSEWKLYEMTFTSPATTSDIQVAFQCAHRKGDYYIDDISFTPNSKMELEELSKDWYKKSDERIDSLRKGDFVLKIRDKNGSPFKGEVEVRLTCHQFEWGTCLNFQGGELESKYKKTALDYFNCGVFENAFKWEEYEKIEGKPNFTDIDGYLKWSKSNLFPLRGHTLVWGTENYGFDKHWARLKSDDLFKEIYPQTDHTGFVPLQR